MTQTAAAARSEGSIRETLESIVIAFVLAFVFRAFVVEAFVIPTGSMAPTLLGQHIRFICPQCGYRVAVGVSAGSYGLKAGDSTPCPMCLYPMRSRGTSADSGDRILVLKYIYKFSEPHRWDVVVFKNPVDPEQNYIKRLVGLPGEQLWIVGGNIYTRPLRDDQVDESAKWQIQRKRDDVQRAVWQPVYRSDYVPLDGGKRTVTGDREREWESPWQPSVETASGWTHSENGLMWRYSGGQQAKPGVLKFAFTPALAAHYCAYNYPNPTAGAENIDDIRVATTVIPRGEATRVSLTLQSSRRRIEGMIEPDGTISLHAAAVDDAGNAGDWQEPVRASIDPLLRDRPMRVELWHVDESASLWVDGKKVATQLFDDISPERLSKMPTRAHMPQAQISVQGDADLRSCDLDRDLYYTQMSEMHGRQPLGTRNNRAVIKSDLFFCLGDNSPESQDSRLWDPPNPWVKDLTNVPTGYVPRDLMIGRAFFVYYPAPWRVPSLDWLPAFPGVPNFGDMRFIH